MSSDARAKFDRLIVPRLDDGYKETLPPFAIGILILQLSPGPDMLLVLDRGIVRGSKAAFSTIAGTVQIGMLVLGMGTLVRDHPSAMLVLRGAGGAYLLYLGIRMMTTRPAVRDLARAGRADIGAGLRDGALSSLTNPKSFPFLFVVLPRFVDPHAGPVWLQMLVLGTIHKLASLLTLGSVALAAERIGRWTRTWPRLLPIQRHLCGMLMVGISLALAIRT